LIEADISNFLQKILLLIILLPWVP